MSEGQWQAGVDRVFANDKTLQMILFFPTQVKESVGTYVLCCNNVITHTVLVMQNISINIISMMYSVCGQPSASVYVQVLILSSI